VSLYTRRRTVLLFWLASARYISCGIYETIERLVLIGCKPQSRTPIPKLGVLSFPKLSVLIVADFLTEAWNNAIN
jgi:hypothetical protein